MKLSRSLCGLVVALLAAGASAGPAAAQRGEAGIVVERPWARASIGTDRPTAAYVTIVNTGKTADRLVGIDSPAAGMVQIHRTMTEDGKSRMGPAGDLTLGPGARIAMKPGGHHIMLMRLKAPVIKGTKLPLVLRFEKAGAIRVDADVLGPGARGPAD